MPPLPSLLSIHPYALLPLLFYQIPSEMTIALLLRIFWWKIPLVCSLDFLEFLIGRTFVARKILEEGVLRFRKNFEGKEKVDFELKGWLWFFFLKIFWNIFFKIVGFALFRSVLWNFYLRMLSHSRKILEGILISRKIGVLKKVDYGFFFKFSNIFLRFEDFLEFLIRRKYSRKIF